MRKEKGTGLPSGPMTVSAHDDGSSVVGMEGLVSQSEVPGYRVSC